ncbi:hypothetical protein [Streptacidiphilus sp. EB129]|uniref:hypothetical protein n=1 Tax=Streptacidiphilus sp. EB129 TaxID=3156262 RepID=UPI0035192E39
MATRDRDELDTKIKDTLAEIDAGHLQDAYRFRGPAGLTKKLGQLSPERAARAAKALGYDYD